MRPVDIVAQCAERLPAGERWRWRAPWACDRCAVPLGGRLAWWRAAERDVPVELAAEGDGGARQVLAALVIVRPIDPDTGRALQPPVWCAGCAAREALTRGVLTPRSAQRAALRARWARAGRASPWDAWGRSPLAEVAGDTCTRLDVEADRRARAWRVALSRRWGVVVQRVTRPRTPALLRLALRGAQ